MSKQTQAIEEYIHDPAGHFSSPKEVLEHAELDAQSKIKILEAWKQEQLQLMKASEENMPGPDPDRLKQVELALTSLEQDLH
ncbi:MAG: hypothetical protein RL839_13200 [Gammaproteobacteria bacterium]